MNKQVLFVVSVIGMLASSGSYVFAIPSEYQQCSAGETCKVGEFVFDDTYAPVTNASCTLKSIYPNGTVFVNSQPMTHISEGWYEYDIIATGSAGLYRTHVCCTVSGENMCLDKSFEIATGSASLTSDQVANAVWNAQRSTYTASGSFGQALQNIVPSSNDIAQAVWGYSGRTLTSFGNLVSDIWSYSSRSLTSLGSLATEVWNVSTRTLTGVDISNGSLATKSDVEAVKTSVSNSIATISATTNLDSDTLQAISKTTKETRLLLEQVVNKPVIETILEEDETPDLQVKLDQTKSVSTQLYITVNRIDAKLGLVKLKWNRMTGREVLTALQEFSTLVGDEKASQTSLLGGITTLQKSWDMPLLEEMKAEAGVFKARLASLESEVRVYGKTTIARDDFLTLFSSFEQIQTQLGVASDSPKKQTFFARLNFITEVAASLSKNDAEADILLSQWNMYPPLSMREKTLTLVKQIESVNSIPQVQLAFQIDSSLTQKQLKNKVLGVKGIIKANKKFLARTSKKPFTDTWLEEGSIVFKTLVTNPSPLISQTVPLKYYLPKEVTKESIVSADEAVQISYDSERDQFFVHGEFTLAQEETKTIAITVDESVFQVSQDEINSLKNQAEQLAEPLKQTSFFAQSVTLKSDIDVALSRIEHGQKNAHTPEARIRAFREARIELEGVMVKMEKLKELVTQSGSAGSLMGFVGGAQVIAVWGLIIILIAGFVSLIIYMRILNPEKKKKNEKKEKSSQEETEEIQRKKTKPSLGYFGIILLFGGFTSILSGGGVYAFLSFTSSPRSVSLQTPSPLSVSPKTEKTLSLDPSESASVAGEFTSLSALKEKKKGWVKENSVGFLRLRVSPGGIELQKLHIGEELLLLSEEKGWTHVELSDGTSGWVSSKYIHTEEKLL